MEFLKIIVGCILASVIYGIVHDQFTAHICVEYFSVFHPPVFPTSSPTLLAFGWGVIATWWVGVILGVPLALASRVGQRPKLVFTQLVPQLGTLLLIMASCALVFGVLGYLWGTVPEFVTTVLTSENAQRRFSADAWAHGASYASGVVGGITLSILTYRRRVRMGTETTKPCVNAS